MKLHQRTQLDPPSPAIDLWAADGTVSSRCTQIKIQSLRQSPSRYWVCCCLARHQTQRNVIERKERTESRRLEAMLPARRACGLQARRSLIGEVDGVGGNAPEHGASLSRRELVLGKQAGCMPARQADPARTVLGKQAGRMPARQADPAGTANRADLGLNLERS